MTADREHQDTRRGLFLLKRWLLLFGLLAAGWCVMTVVHECGHLLGGWIGGGRLRDVELRPWRLPHSSFDPDPWPLLTLWSGPVVGVIAPMVVAALLKRSWLWLIAHFCVLANGTYLAAAWVSGERFLDTARLLDAGAHPASIAAFCVITVGYGYPRFRGDCRAVLVQGS